MKEAIKAIVEMQEKIEDLEKENETLKSHLEETWGQVHKALDEVESYQKESSNLRHEIMCLREGLIPINKRAVDDEE